MFNVTTVMNFISATVAEGTNFSGISQPIVDLINGLFKPLMSIVGAVGALYCVMLGVKYAKAEEPQEHEKAKNHLKNAVIGFVLIFVLLLALNVGTRIMTNWYDTNKNNGAEGTSAVAVEVIA